MWLTYTNNTSQFWHEDGRENRGSVQKFTHLKKKAPQQVNELKKVSSTDREQREKKTHISP